MKKQIRTEYRSSKSIQNRFLNRAILTIKLREAVITNIAIKMTATKSQSQNQIKVKSLNHQIIKSPIIL